MSAELKELQVRAMGVADAYVRRVGAADLVRATPCAGWTLADLLAHMVGQHRGFAAAARAGDAPAAAYAPQPFTPDGWVASVAELLAAFDAADLDGRAVLCEIAPTPLPMTFAISAQLLDTVVHTWDVARSLGEWHEPDAELRNAVADIAAAVPNDARRTRPNAAFAPSRTGAGSTWVGTLAHLGRDPGPS